MSSPRTVLIVDPESSQADKLRHLLNVVSGRAPDANGKTSEPLVKEELAIVEFLTAKTSAPAPRGKDETPVDLLLGLAKTRSGRRAAEEERRQLRQQAAREVEEQRAQQKRQAGMASPWGYKPPSMPGLDVVQPFDMTGQRREGPRPLQPPPARKPALSWSPEVPAEPRPQYKSPENIFPSPSQQQFNLDMNYQLPQFQPIIPTTSPTQTLDPFSGSMDLFPNLNPQGTQFGNPMDQFDFSNLGLNLDNNQTGLGGFNPFALPQTEEG